MSSFSPRARSRATGRTHPPAPGTAPAPDVPGAPGPAHPAGAGASHTPGAPRGPRRPPRRAAAGPLYVLAAAGLWGSTGTAASFAPAGASPLSIGAATMGFGGLLTLALAGRSVPGVLLGGRTVLLWVVLGGTAVGVYPLAFYASMRLAGVAAGTVVTIGSAPLFAALLERALDGSRLTPRWLAATAAAGTGCALLALTAADGTGGGRAATVAPGDVPCGMALGLLGGAAYAVYTCYGARVIRAGHSSRAAMGALFGLGALLLLPVLAVTGGPLLTHPRGLAVAGYLAVVPMCGAYVLFGAGLARVPASTVTTLTLFEPAVAAVLAVAVVGERLGPWSWTGVGLVLLGLLVLTAPSAGRPPRAGRAPRGVRR